MAKENPAAVKALGEYGVQELALIRRIALNGPPNVKATALAQWQIFEPREAAPIAADFLSNGAREEDCVTLLASFMQRQTSETELAKSLANKTIPPNVATVALKTINAGGRGHENLKRAFAGKTPGPKIANSQFVAEVRERGDAQRGAEIFKRAELGCTVCHKVNGNGGNIGPDLSALGTAQPIDFIAGAILDPQKEIKEGFASVFIATKSGDEFQGYIARESADEIVLREPLANREIRLRRDQIASHRANGSLMPNGLADQLTSEEFRDLVKFLSTLGKP